MYAIKQQIESYQGRDGFIQVTLCVIGDSLCFLSFLGRSLFFFLYHFFRLVRYDLMTRKWKIWLRKVSTIQAVRSADESQ